MRGRGTTLGVAVLVVIATVMALLVPSTAGGAAARFTPTINRDFPDPGVARFGNVFYLYSTGGGFPSSASAAPNQPFPSPQRSMAGSDGATMVPAWVGRDPGGRFRLWAPSVFSVPQGFGARYVMYFTAWSRAGGRNCIGVAEADRPAGPFVPQRRPAVCASAGHEAIDPDAFQAQDGRRYLVYKVSHANETDFAIRSLPMDATGTHASGPARTLLAPRARMEAPSLVQHRNAVWMFVSRGGWRDCDYRTEVWRAPSFGARFTRVETLLSTQSTGLCGPGGADVSPDGTRIAFHAWRPDHSARPTYLARLWWGLDGLPSVG
jgi:hypothetical protein